MALVARAIVPSFRFAYLAVKHSIKYGASVSTCGSETPRWG